MLEAFIAERITLCVPALWIYEVGNTLSRKLPTMLSQALPALRRLELPEAEMGDDWAARSAEIAVRYGVTFYDAAYHALAIQEAGVFVTADERYLQKTAELGHIAHLRDWQAAARTLQPESGP